ncbi:MAG: hypothetical protein Q4P18_07995 [Methanobrevibacter sp.]|uniref:hypothetical protein n=1 Tax=Methanobrevibacter sp. TaxID=66852 RepID=UPI0026DFDBF6|nr:hypothetical protein [Methanobrevibacter sp.]MDO5849462.1 hypothetical protein [Methanobrevibacter sp.]
MELTITKRVNQIFKEEGYKEGYEKGEEKGEVKKSEEIAKNMLIKDFDLDDIIECTGLSESRLSELKKTI